MNKRDLKLSIGPIPYFWPRDTVKDFYAQLVGAPVDCIHVGETVCSKRRELSTADWLDLAGQLAESGKEVMISTLALIEAGSELSTLKRYATNGEFLIEANDLAGIEIATSMRMQFMAGPTVNIYNGRTLSVLVSRGLVRWVPPVELSGKAVRSILDEFESLEGVAARERLETEVLVYGRLPLAHSARCFTARYHDRQKDSCGFICLEHPEGLRARTRDDEPFLRLNGIQVQSDSIHAVQELGSVVAAGADRIRLSPTGDGFFDVVDVYASWIAGEQGELAQANLVSGYWYDQPGMNPVPGG